MPDARDVFERIASFFGIARARADRQTALIAAGIVATLLVFSIGVAVLIHSGRSRGRDGASEGVPTPDLVRPVRPDDFVIPPVRLSGPDGEFYRYRSPDRAWSESELERLRLDTFPVTVDILRERNEELLRELVDTDIR